MGALHAGHLKLIEIATKQCDNVIVSVYVNALQFGDSTDFDKYPRSIESDYDASMQAGATVVFAPTSADIFPPGFDNFVTPSSLANDFEGVSRPGHFAGVVTVVNRLFDLVKPDVAIFGTKDFQQLAVIRSMSYDLHPSVKIQGVETIRDKDGLALSSRNSRLSPTARKEARVIPEALSSLRSEFQAGQTNCADLKSIALKIFETCQSVIVEYLEIVNCETLQKQQIALTNDSVVLFAGTLHGVRLIDNVEL
jgi:pantoate--beta-alanine ligase